MTLVLGYADSVIGFLVADSLLTPTMASEVGKGPVAGQFHGLKIQIVHLNIALAFASANDASATLKIIKNISDEISHGELDDLPERLFKKYKMEAHLDSEFLVLQIKSDAKELTHVTSRGISRCTRAYIGDSAEYKKLVKLRTQYEPMATQLVQEKDESLRQQPLVVGNGEKEFAEVSDALEDLVHKRGNSVGAIGGCVVRVVDARISKTLEYMQAVESSVGPAEGQSGFSLLASNTETRGIGIYYLSGKLGFILVVGDSEHIRKEYAETIDDFIEVGKAKYGLNLTGGKPQS
jgi:hypothetical protein